MPFNNFTWATLFIFSRLLFHPTRSHAFSLRKRKKENCETLIKICFHLISDMLHLVCLMLQALDILDFVWQKQGQTETDSVYKFFCSQSHPSISISIGLASFYSHIKFVICHFTRYISCAGISFGWTVANGITLAMCPFDKYFREPELFACSLNCCNFSLTLMWWGHRRHPHCISRNRDSRSKQCDKHPLHLLINSKPLTALTPLHQILCH